MAAFASRHTTEISFYKREGKEFLPLFNKTSPGAHGELGVPLDAGESTVHEAGRQAGRQPDRKHVWHLRV